MNPKTSLPSRRSRLILAGAVALVIAVAGWPETADESMGLAREGDSAAAPIASLAARADARADDDTAGVAVPMALMDLAGEPQPLLPTDVPAFAAPDPEKLIAQLEKKKAKKEAKIEAKEQKIADADAAAALLLDELALAEQALVDAEALPQDTPEQIKAREKAIKAALKAIAKLEKKLGRIEKQIDKLEAVIDKVEDQIVDLDEQIDVIADALPGTLPDIGVEGLAGLRLPERVEIVTADDETGEGGGSAFLGLGGGDPTANFDPGADYFTDAQHAYIHDRSMESLETVNSILCQLRQTAYDELVNIGPYNAQIDRALCDEGVQDDGGNGGQSGDESETVEMWVVDSRRTTEADDHYVGLWVPEDDKGGGGGGDGGGGKGGGPGGESFPDGTTIRVLTHIEEGESDLHPFGVFDLDFAAVPPGGTADDVLFWGTLATAEALDGYMGFRFFQEEGDESDDQSWFSRTQVHVNMFTDGTQGVARVKQFHRDPFGGPGGPGSGPFEETQEFLLAFDEQNLLRNEVGADEQCLSRVDFDTSVWRYNLYAADGDQAGERVKLNSGFGFKTAAGEFGWAGYHGLWYPDHITLETGDVVYENSYGPPGGDPPAEYEVYIAPGKLWEYTRAALALAELDGETFEWWSFSGAPGSQPTVYLLEYDGLNGEFVAVAEQQGKDFVFFDPQQQFAVDRQMFPWLGMWSPSLGGSVDHLDGDDFVTFFEERVVDANHPLLAGGDVQLFGLLDCLDTGILGSDAEQGDVYLPDAFDPGNPHVYQFRADDLGLHLDTFSDGTSYSEVGLAPGETYDSGPYSWGMRSGPLVTSLDGITNPFDLFHADVTYVYETGPNPWNHYSTLRDDQDVLVSFDPPIQFTYVHSLANDRNGDDTYAGKTYQLEYNGPGDLWGIPQEGVDLDGDGHEDRWYPRFSLADSVLLGPTGSEYVVKALEMEQRLAEDPDGCDALTTGPVASLPLPDGSGYGFPDIGELPVVTDPPAVIGGEVQGGD